MKFRYGRRGAYVAKVALLDLPEWQRKLILAGPPRGKITLRHVDPLPEAKTFSTILLDEFEAPVREN